MNSFVNCISAEWIKKRRSFADWLVWLGAFFIPVINSIIFLAYPKQLTNLQTKAGFWEALFYKSWQSMSIMLLPLGIVLAVSLLTQLEFKNNTWKQLHTTPVPFTSIFFSKLLLLIVMLIQLVFLFNIGMILSAFVPAMLHPGIDMPTQAIPLQFLLIENGKFMLLCLPLIALQYLISLQFRNFLIPIGAGLALVVGSLIALSWKYIYLLPYSYTALFYLQSEGKAAMLHNIFAWSLGYFILFTLLGYMLYLFKKEKG